MPKNEKDKKVKTFKEWLEDQGHVNVLGNDTYYRFPGTKGDFMVKVKDVPETLQLGDKLKYIKTEKGEPEELAVSVAEFYGTPKEETVNLLLGEKKPEEK